MINRAKEIGLIAHDLKGPIGNLSMFAEMLSSLLEQAQASEEKTDLSQAIWYSQYIHLISSKYLDQLQNWADFYLIDAEHIQSGKEIIVLQDSIEQALESNATFLEKKHISIQKLIDEELCVKFDREMMRRVLDNLIQIVVLLASHKSVIQVKLFRDDFYQVQFRISGLHQNDRTLFDGLFIPKEINFDTNPFQKGIIKTTGMGLAYCSKALRLFDGKPQLDEVEGQLYVGFSLPVVV
jgi:signal transduction histidine kinase